MTADDDHNFELLPRRSPSRAVIFGFIVLGLFLIGRAVATMSMSHGNAVGVPAALDEARHRGVVKVGVNYLPPPITLADYETRRPEGFDTVIAGELTKVLGSKVELVALKPGAAVSALNGGDVDMLLVHVPAAERSGSRFEIVDTGYVSGTMPLMRSDTRITGWNDFSGRTVCVSAGNAEAQAAAERFGGVVRILKAPAKSLVEVRTGACEAAIGDEAEFRALLRQPNWEKYSGTLPPVDPFRLVFALRTGDRISAQALKAIADRWLAEDTWSAWKGQWGADVAFEVYLDQDAPDCH